MVKKIDAVQHNEFVLLQEEYTCFCNKVTGIVSGEATAISVLTIFPLGINIIYHWSLMQTEKPQHEGKRIMPEKRFTRFRHRTEG